MAVGPFLGLAVTPARPLSCLRVAQRLLEEFKFPSRWAFWPPDRSPQKPMEPWKMLSFHLAGTLMGFPLSHRCVPSSGIPQQLRGDATAEGNVHGGGAGGSPWASTQGDCFFLE